jgi:hypothetical protein
LYGPQFPLPLVHRPALAGDPSGGRARHPEPGDRGEPARFLDPGRKRLRAGEIVGTLLEQSPEFAELWRAHPVAGPYCAPVRIQHPELGLLDLHCQTLVDPDQSQAMLVYTATPGSESYEKLKLLSVLGPTRLAGID